MEIEEELTINVKLSALALRLRSLRKKKGESIQDTAEQIGTRPSKLMKWETDKALPSMEELALLANHFGVTREYLLGMSI